MLIFERSYDNFMILSYDQVKITIDQVMITICDLNFVITLDYDCFSKI